MIQDKVLAAIRRYVMPTNRILVKVDGVVTGIWAERLEDVIVIVLPKNEDLQDVWQADGNDELFRIKPLAVMADDETTEEMT